MAVLQGLALEIESISIVRQWRYTVLLAMLVSASSLGGVRGRLLGSTSVLLGSWRYRV